MSQMFYETIIQCDGTIYVHVAQMNADRCARSAAEYVADRDRSVRRLEEELSRRKKNKGKNNELYKLVTKCPNEKIHFQYYNSRNLLCNKEEKIGFTQTNSKESQVLKTNFIKTKLGM